MRADLHLMEQIDLYLQGKMSAAESAAFRARMEADPGLAKMVAEQQLFAQSVNRQAIMAEINLVAAGGAGGAWYANPFVGAAGLVVAGGIVAAAVYYNSGTDEMITDGQTAAEDQVIENKQAEPEQIITASGDTIQYSDILADRAEDRDDEPEAANSDDSETNATAENDTEIYPDEKEDGSIVDADDDVTTAASGRLINKKACFPNGDIARRNYIEENVIYPGTAQKEQLQGTVKVAFNVDKEGQKSEIEASCIAMFDANEKRLTATQMKLKQSIAKLFEDKAISTVRTMPDWEPATDSQGNPVVSSVTLYFKFSLPGDIIVYEIPNE